MFFITLFFISIILLCIALFACLLFIRSTCEIIYEFYLMHIAPRIGCSINLKQRFGEFVLVTGATDGIGKGYVFALAAKGLNIILVSRNEEKLKKVIAEAKELYPDVNYRYIVHDFSKKDEKDKEKFDREIGPLYSQIGILVNNVGIAGEFGKDFVAAHPDPLNIGYEVVQVNVNSMVLMTSLLLPKFIKNKRGIVINISSLAAVHPCGGMAIYNATKSFIDFFSRSIRQESFKSNVLVQTVYPGFVKTNILGTTGLRERLPSYMAPEFIPFSRGCVETIGALPETYGCFVHRLQAYFISGLKCLPPQLSDRILIKISNARDSFFAIDSNNKKD